MVHTMCVIDIVGKIGSIEILKAGVAQLVERQPSKLQVAGSSLVSRSMLL